ncbi:MAG TPA: BTAD domain-containing putative transcriptional regulator [Gemmatimonadaceae bacterium]|nr:BTAD domain-containing putative transcriptional regulator [Gemmatimonadaceae bacterium]
MPRHRLITLGRLALVDERGVEDPIGKRRRKLALLATLAMTRRPISRDTLVDLFWGEQPEDRARHSLSDALSHLRSVLGKDAIAARQAEVSLTPDAELDVDAIGLSAAAAAGDHEKVVALYQGAFLDAVYIADSPRFEQWVARERARIDRAFRDACAAVCRAAATEERWAHCAATAQRWLDADPECEEAREALRRAEVETARTAAASGIPTAPAPVIPSEAPTSSPVIPSEARDLPSGSRSPHRERYAGFLAPLGMTFARFLAPLGMTAVVLALVLLAARIVSRHTVSAAESARQAVAIIDSRAPASDSSVAWLRDGFAQMVAASLERTPTLEVVPATRVHALLARMSPDGGPVDDAHLADAATQLGARWGVRASLTRIDQAYVVQLDVRDARDGSSHAFTISGTNVLAVADEAAARVRSIADAAAPGPHLADLETANVDAFEHFVRAQQAQDEGRYADQIRELDAAVAADSGFTSAIVARMRIARYQIDTLTIARLSSAYARASSRITRWDALEQAQYLAFHNGEHARAEELARELVDTYPHDPRAYGVLANTLALHGKWAAADSVLERALRLDSLAMAAGHGPCAPCSSYFGLIENHLIVGDVASAERAARRWLALQPDLPAAWAELATVLAFDGRYDDALDAERHASQLAGDDAEYAIRMARILVMARRLDAADSLVRTWPMRVPDYRDGALDLESVIERERGEYARAERTLNHMVQHGDGGMGLVHASQLAQLGRYQDSRREFEAMTAHGPLNEPNSPVQSLAGDRARTFAWHHALEADALAPTRDTVRLDALADSIARIGARSYFARDWRLADHVRGIVALERGNARDAIAQLQRARLGVAAWTRTNLWLARAFESAGRADSAVAVLRDAYESPPDAMGRYLTRSELDYEMARAFAAAHASDSARIYAGYAATAWAHADPIVQPRRREMLALARQAPRPGDAR